MFEQFLERLKNLFSNNSSEAETNQPPFPNRAMRGFSPMRRKKFDIIRIIDGPNRPQPPLNNGGMRIESQTRPKICPVCQTSDRITSVSARHWKCTVCEYSWRS